MEQYKIKSVRLILENCESLKIEAKDIYILEYTLDYEYVRNVNQGNEIDRTKHAKRFYISFNGLENITCKSNFVGENKSVSVFERLRTPDITHVLVVFDNGPEDYFCTEWCGGRWINNIQKLRMNKYINKWELEITNFANTKRILSVLKYKVFKAY